jgi:hypothetical protein
MSDFSVRSATIVIGGYTITRKKLGNTDCFVKSENGIHNQNDSQANPKHDDWTADAQNIHHSELHAVWLV